jgi:hypothetical protein
MGRRLVTGMYRNVDFSVGKRGPGDAIEYERSYRLCTAEFIRDQKEKRGAFKQITHWWRMMYPKKMPGAYKPRMARTQS